MRIARVGLAMIAAACGACVARSVPRTASHGEVVADAGRTARVALAVGASRASLQATGAWELRDGEGKLLVARLRAGDVWTIERRGSDVRAASESRSTPWRSDAIVARATEPDAYVSYNGHRWRGELWAHPTSSGITVVNRLPVEDYLRGVLPLELNMFSPRDAAALEAQAVAARSYVYSRMPEFEPRDAAIRHASLPYDVRATVSDQVYGGRDVEHPAADASITSTAGLVLRYNGAVVSAPYHSSCGGSTAEPSELWKADAEPYLKRVSDRIPGTDRYYCDIAPRFHWTRSWDEAELRGVLARYLRDLGGRTPDALGDVAIESRTASGRVSTLSVTTDARRAELRGNDIRFAVRSVGGEILPSTYFSVETERDASGRVARVTMRGNGNGHGVGMCQWGAVGRARAGQNFRTILRAYFPGASIDPVE